MRIDTRPRQPARGAARPQGCLWLLVALVFLGMQAPAEARQIIHNSIVHDTTWTAEQAPYLLTGMIVVAADATLRIQPWVTVRFMPGARLAVEGRLTGEKAYFDGWKGLANREMIFFRDGSQGDLRHCILENLEISLASSDVALTRNLIANRNGNGVTVGRHATPRIARNDFRHNSYYAVYKIGRHPFNAPDNYWGADDGPGGAGSGQGNAINPQVVYQPFAKAENDDHVLLKHHHLDQRECRQGDRLNLEFTLFNYNTYVHDLILGASLYRQNQTPVHSTPDDLKVRVLPGLNVFKRSFRLPARLPVGRYDVAWGVMKTDLSTYLVFKKEGDALEVRAADKKSRARQGGLAAIVPRAFMAADYTDLFTSAKNGLYRNPKARHVPP